MVLGIVFNVIALITLIYFIIQFLNTRTYIYKLPIMTRSKYIGLELMSKRILVISLVLFVASIFVKNIIGKALLTMVMIFLVSYAISELNVLKEYVVKKRK